MTLWLENSVSLSAKNIRLQSSKEEHGHEEEEWEQQQEEEEEGNPISLIKSV